MRRKCGLLACAVMGVSEACVFINLDRDSGPGGANMIDGKPVSPSLLDQG